MKKPHLKQDAFCFFSLKKSSKRKEEIHPVSNVVFWCVIFELQEEKNRLSIYVLYTLYICIYIKTKNRDDNTGKQCAIWWNMSGQNMCRVVL